jgi:ABC-type nitrate/sulfonate/bicarbonate transport system substrate-binding protein
MITILKKFSMPAFIIVLALFSILCSRTERSRPEKITIAFAPLPDTALDQIATVNRYYEDEGLIVTRQMHQIGKRALQSVLEGKADFATVAETPVMLSIANGGQISIVATIDTSRNNMAILARKDRGITGIGDLRGKKIATTFGTISEFFMNTILIMNRIPPKEITAVNLPPEKLPGALESGEVDAISIWNPLLIRMQNKLGDAVVTFYGEEFYKQFYVIVANRDYVQKNPGVVRKLLRSLIRAEEYANREPSNAQKIVAEGINTDKALLSAIWENNDFRVDLGQPLILVLEEESRWAMNNKLTKVQKVPNYLDNIYLEGLKAVKPEAVRIFR